MAISQVQLFSVPVTDQDRARDFYVGILGFELVREMPMGPGMRWVQVRPRGGQTSITLVTRFESMPAGSLTGVVLESDDLEADVARLRRLGGVGGSAESTGTSVRLEWNSALTPRFLP